ncbi:MAG: CMP/dCMP deaminase zinc-binding protein [Streptosporangiaceae bacterium]|nr:CMP/dCMP deaminase zinc-binding protein [Streptosporangiaceae bacterium]
MDDRRARDLAWLELAADLAAECPPSGAAFSVGAVIVSAAGEELARGHSRETDTAVHAEEAALAKLAGAAESGGGPDLGVATIYSSLEPCGRRASRPKPCARLILEAGIRRVVYAWREPALFVEAEGADLLRGAGVTVIELPELADRARRPNAHLLG